MSKSEGRDSKSDGRPKSEVGDVRLTLLVEQNVPRLEISVQDAALVRVVNGAGDQANDE